MTGSLRAVAHALARSAASRTLAEERLLACERVAATLANRRLRVTPLPDPDRALRRLVRDGWRGAVSDARLAAAVAEALGRRRRSLDRALIHAWLMHWPADRPAGAVLRAAASAAADRHDWSWSERGRRWRLWDGPATLRAAIAEATEPEPVLRAAGLDGALAGGRFARAATRSDHLNILS